MIINKNKYGLLGLECSRKFFPDPPCCIKYFSIYRVATFGWKSWKIAPFFTFGWKITPFFTFGWKIAPFLLLARKAGK